MAEEKDVSKKMNSRKFIVWLVWLCIAILDLLIDVAIVIITKNITGEMVALTEKILGWFFAISMMYLGMNVSQKVGLELADKLATSKE